MADQQMTVGDALQELTKFKNVWRAAEKLDAALAVVQDIEGRKIVAEAALKDMLNRTSAASADLVRASLALAAKLEVVEKTEREYEDKLVAAKTKFDADMAELSEQYSMVSVAARDKVAQEIKDEQAKVDAITAKKGDLQRDVRMLQAEVETLRQRKAVP